MMISAKCSQPLRPISRMIRLSQPASLKEMPTALWRTGTAVGHTGLVYRFIKPFIARISPSAMRTSMLISMP